MAVHVVPEADLHRHRVLIIGLSLAIMWAGMALRFRAFHMLGRYFTFTVMTSSDQQIVTAGPYRLLRHPSYAGVILILAGVGLAVGNWLSPAATVLLSFMGFIYRFKVEEAALLDAVGDAYGSYAGDRKWLIPFVW